MRPSRSPWTMLTTALENQLAAGAEADLPGTIIRRRGGLAERFIGTHQRPASAINAMMSKITVAAAIAVISAWS